MAKYSDAEQARIDWATKALAEAMFAGIVGLEREEADEDAASALKRIMRGLGDNASAEAIESRLMIEAYRYEDM